MFVEYCSGCWGTVLCLFLRESSWPGRAQNLWWEQGLGLEASDQGSVWGVVSTCLEDLVEEAAKSRRISAV